MNIITTRRFALWWKLAQQWFNTRFERLQTAVSQIEVDIHEDLAKKTDIPTVAAIQNGLAKATDIPAVPTDYAKKSDIPTIPTDYARNQDLRALYYKTHVDDKYANVPNVIITELASLDFIGIETIGNVCYFEYYCPTNNGYRYFVDYKEIKVGDIVYFMDEGMSDLSVFAQIVELRTERIALVSDTAKQGTNADATNTAILNAILEIKNMLTLSNGEVTTELNSL